MSKDYDEYDRVLPGFESIEEYHALANDLEARHMHNIQAMEQIRQHTVILKEKTHELDQDRTLLYQQSGDLKFREEALKVQERQLIADQTQLRSQVERVGVTIDQVARANRPAMQTIDDVLLQLELDVDPKEIAESVREFRKTLDVKW